MVPCKSTAEEVSFEWSHHRISSTDSKVRTTLHVSIIDCGKERVKAQIIIIFSFCFVLSIIVVSFYSLQMWMNARNSLVCVVRGAV